jgi:hypothetical protein
MASFEILSGPVPGGTEATAFSHRDRRFQSLLLHLWVCDCCSSDLQYSRIYRPEFKRPCMEAG